jgi:hypothetical protein
MGSENPAKVADELKIAKKKKTKVSRHYSLNR